MFIKGKQLLYEGKGISNSRMSNCLMAFLEKRGVSTHWVEKMLHDASGLWDLKTHKKLDQECFCRDLGGVEEAYAEIMKRMKANLA